MKTDLNYPPLRLCADIGHRV